MPRLVEPERVERGLYRAGKTYIACVTPQGQRRPRRKTLGEVGLMEARRLRDEFRVELNKGRGGPSPADGRMTFAALADEWLHRQRQLTRVGELAPRTLEAYETATRVHLVPFFGARLVRNIQPDDLVEWYADQRASGAAAWSIKNRWSSLRAILGHAARRRIIATNPADLLESRERPRAGDSRKRFLSDDEMRALLGAAAPRYRLLIAVCLFGGLRLSEALGLTWSDIDLAGERINVNFQLDRRGKRARVKTAHARRQVILMGALGSMLRRAKLAAAFSNRSDPVFATATRSTISARNATRAFEKTCRGAELDGVTFHALRHTFASLLIAQGRDPVFVADQLGHADPAITLRVYAHLFRAAKQAKEAQRLLDAEYGGMLRQL